MRKPRKGRAALRLSLMGKILRFRGAAAYRRLLLDALRTYFRLNTKEQAEELRLLQSGEYVEVNEMLQTELGRLERAAERRGLQHALAAVLFSRFPGTAPDVIEDLAKVQDPEAIERLIRRASTASSLDEVWPVRGH